MKDEFGDDDVQESQVSDPLYYLNFGMYQLNDLLFTGFINPAAQAYHAMTPVVVRKGVRNFFHNLLFPVRLANTFLQGKWSSTGQEIKIFLINSTIGIAGFRQPAQNDFNLRTSDEDLGQTFGFWSIGEGFYLVLPVMGPSTLRDAIGLAGDSFLKPLNYVEPWELSMGLRAYEQVNNISFYLGEYEDFKKAAVNPYSAFKNAYIQNRKKKIRE